MRMLMIVCPEHRQEDIRKLLTEHDVHMYTEIQEVVGEGKAGKKLGTTIWPEKSVLVFTVVKRAREEALVRALKECAGEFLPGEGMSAFVLPAERVV